MHNARDLVVDSVTGVDLALPVAGPGARSYAFLIDWLIRVSLFTAWYGVAALIYNHRWTLIAPLNPDAKWFVLVVTPAAAMYFLYHFVLEIAMHGRTPGKRMAGIHLVTREGAPPSIGALLARNVFRLVDTLPLLYGVGLLATLTTRDHVRIGDMAAGTLLVYDRPDAALPSPPTTGTPVARPLRTSDAEIITDLLTRWPQLETDARQRLATTILSRHTPATAILARHAHATTISPPHSATASPSQQHRPAAAAATASPHSPNIAALSPRDGEPRAPRDLAATPPTHTDAELRTQLERLLQGDPT